jgi:hypothetical protein
VATFEKLLWNLQKKRKRDYDVLTWDTQKLFDDFAKTYEAPNSLQNLDIKNGT